ncbi:MBL fold metallo-hydrolase [Finegoldia magna]|nr:MBL fold metallo-hydrolase [Finegoldia magna]MDU5508815.1 MBL fold metallo-hydrolase [Finegoldia magna]
MPQIFDDLYQFTSYAPPIDLTFHQYLLNIDEPILIHTGSRQQAQTLLPQIKDVLMGRKLKYIFVSHFESDECGGLEIILKEFPEARVIASEVTAGQLDGFGIAGDVLIKRPEEKMKIGETEFKFISYPSEMHLWEGLLLLDLERKILFSSDLMIRFGNSGGEILENTLEGELDRITKEQIPDTEKREKLIGDLKKEDIKFIATGHGECIAIMSKN